MLMDAVVNSRWLMATYNSRQTLRAAAHLVCPEELQVVFGPASQSNKEYIIKLKQKTMFYEISMQHYHYCS